MFRIAVCDDDPLEIKIILKLLSEYQACNTGVEIHTECFNCGDKLLENLSVGGKSYDLFLLDIFMSGISGIDLARKLRKDYTWESDVPIVFLTSSPDFTHEAFRVWATQYLLKPVGANEFFNVLDKLLALKKHEDEGSFAFVTPGKIVNIPFKDIVFIELESHIMKAHLKNGETALSKNIRVPFRNAIAPLLCDKRFLYPHTSFVLNMAYVKEMNTRSFLMEGNYVIPVPKYNVADAKTKYLDWLMQKGGIKI